jgi:hypothetical protein
MILETFCPECKCTRKVYLVGHTDKEDVYECGVCNFIIKVKKNEQGKIIESRFS